MRARILGEIMQMMSSTCYGFVYEPLSLHGIMLIEGFVRLLWIIGAVLQCVGQYTSMARVASGDVLASFPNKAHRCGSDPELRFGELGGVHESRHADKR